MLDITTAVTGAVINGFTTPGYTLAADTAPVINGKRSIVSALTGTQTGVRSHAPTDPFDITITKPLKTAAYPRANPITGAIGKVERNRYETRVRKGVVPLTGQSPQEMTIQVIESIPAGAESNDVANVAACYSMLAAWYTREAANLLVRAKTGSL